MDIEKALKAQMKLNKNMLEALSAVNKSLLARIEDLEKKAVSAEMTFVTESLAFGTAAMLARDFPLYGDRIIMHCKAGEPPDHLDKDAVAAAFKLLTDYFKDPDKKIMPRWFGGVIDGGKSDSQKIPDE